MADAVGKIGKLGRGFLDAGLQRFDLGLELRQGFGIARGDGGAVSSLAMRASSAAMSGCGPFDPAAAKTAPGEGETDNADQAAEHARGKMGDEAFQLGKAGLSGRQRLRLRRDAAASPATG